MIDLYENKSYWKKCYKKCLKYRNNLSWDILIGKVIDVYNKISI